MIYVVCFFTELVKAVLVFFQLVLFVSSVLEYMPFEENSVIYKFVKFISEWLNIPASKFCSKVSILSNLPVDISYTVTIAGLFVLSRFLPQVIL